ncbi:MAG: PQQ-dependent sugar dehydrogenase, partial [Pseudomonadota bacterium]|nr:PQQ-dependent sugar dehydrogenase [Pseudomonadota bacterium]
MPTRYATPLMTPHRSLRLQAKRWVAPSLVGLMLASTAQAEVVHDALETDHFAITIERVANGFANPWAVAFLPDGRYLVSERSGELNLVDSDGQTQVLEGMPRVSQNGQGGLLDVALHPEFGDGEHDWIYFTWSKPEGNNSRSALSRVKWKGDSLG